jgi:hypothetical protein
MPGASVAIVRFYTGEDQERSTVVKHTGAPYHPRFSRKAVPVLYYMAERRKEETHAAHR